MEVFKDSNGSVMRIRMRKPTDMHQHLRDGAMLQLVGTMVAQRFRSAIVMPNLVPPITTCDQANLYMIKVRTATDFTFWPLMTMFLTDALSPAEVCTALKSKLIIGIKYYPPGLTTNSDSGVQNPASLWTRGTQPHQCLVELAAHKGVLLLHAADGVASADWDNGTDADYEAGEELDPWDQELHFLNNTLPRIRDAHPELKISVEHLSTADGASYIREHGGEKLGCSLTAHHLLLDRRDVFRGGFRPHRSWMPVIQPKEHRDALRELAVEDLPFVWLGSDSAPHVQAKKESSCCASGVLMAHAGIELYAEAFEDMGALDDRFERFASINGRTFYDVDNFYSLRPRDEYIDLVREEWKVQPFFIADGNQGEPVIPFRLGETVRWKLIG